MNDITSVVLDELGSLEAPPGSREWAVAVRLEIQSLLKDAESNAWHLQTWLKAMEKHAGYRQLSDSRGQPFANYEAFCVARLPYGLGYETADINRIIKERKDAQTRAETARPLNQHGGDHKQDISTLQCNVDIKQGNHADYLTRRIARDRPDILEGMKQGKYKSVRAAALDAGIVRPQVTLPLEPSLAARVLRRHFTHEQIAELISLLVE